MLNSRYGADGSGRNQEVSTPASPGAANVHLRDRPAFADFEFVVVHRTEPACH